LWFYPFKKHYILCFLWFFAQAEPSAWLNNAKKPVFWGFFAKQEAGKRRLAKAVSEGTLSEDFADIRRSTNANPSAPSADASAWPNGKWISYF
jgi:hypothetical protein